MIETQPRLFYKARSINVIVMLLLAFVVLGMDVGDSQGPAALGFAQAAKKVRRKRRRFDAAQAVKDMKDTW